ncbi:hypothetical protein KFK09_027195 [Dendrobium nobile]|uniref:Uncharacterized protein n=1 Tax=Dendrobium nobile TaxID=94219 RepID=A0A8T3A9X5_DENNO|nr:hypothetical protein KFK09_027195 [Dendrobium nobile]
MEAMMKLTLKVPLLLLLVVFLAVAKAQDGEIAPSPALENGAVGFVPVLCTLLFTSLVSFFALISQ